jgi:drug/metabolite transporter (DMT)-like permease
MYFTGNAYSKVIYLFYSYLFAAAFLLVVFLGYWIFRKVRATPEGPTYRPFIAVPKAVPYIAVMAICLFAASYLQTAATGDYGMPSQVLYPLIKGGSLATVNLTGLCFGERITRRTVLGTIVSVIGILIMSISF